MPNSLRADQVKQAFGLDGATSAFCVHVAPGTEKDVTFYVAHYKDGIEAQLEDQPLKLMYDALYSDMNDILKTAEKQSPRRHRPVRSDGQQTGRLRTG